MQKTPEQASERATGEAEASTLDASTLEAAQEAFERGDFARVRAITAALMTSKDAELAQSAAALRRRVEVDPMQVAILVLCLLFFTWVAWKYVFSQ